MKVACRIWVGRVGNGEQMTRAYREDSKLERRWVFGGLITVQGYDAHVEEVNK